MSWKLFKLRTATDEFLLEARMQGRLVYTPYPGTTRFCNTLRKQKSVSGPRRLMKQGMLAYNSGDTRPCDGYLINPILRGNGGQSTPEDNEFMDLLNR